jgi:acetyl-CoA carboxylase biotin carboxyl carrier protein
MELKQIKELMAAMERTGTTEIGIKKEGFEIQLKRAEPKNGHATHSSIDYEDDYTNRIETNFQKRPAAIALSGKETQSLAHAEPKAVEDSTSLFITSPMVGTFYSSPSPDEPPFVKVGDRVEKNTVVCIVEAMKVMNEVKSGVTGIVAEVFIESSHPVEFGTKLFRITPQ